MHRACDGWHATLVKYRNRTRHSERKSGELRCIIQAGKRENFLISIHPFCQFDKQPRKRVHESELRKISFSRRLELLERLSKGAKDTHVPGDRWNIRNHAHDVAHLLADTVEEAGNAPGSIQQAPNFLHEIDHHRLIMLPARLVRDGWVGERNFSFVSWENTPRLCGYGYIWIKFCYGRAMGKI